MKLISIATLLVSSAFAEFAGAQTPATMRAVRIHAFGKPDVLRYEEAPKPEPKANEVLVRVFAAGVNPVDWKLRSGMFGSRGAQLPFILGFDVAGVVEKVGADVKRFEPGDAVFGYLSIQRGGCYAEYVAAAENELAGKSEKADMVHAAAVPLAALTAWQALFDTAGLKEGQTVLIHAGAGGVGHFAVQLAKAKGAKVIATGSAGNAEFLKQLGADQVIDYKSQKFEELAHDVDVVLDSIGGDTQARSLGVLKKGGYLVSIVQPPEPTELEKRGLQGSIFLVKPNGEQLTELAALIDSGKLKPEVSLVVPLAEAKRAHEASETGHTRGKIVLQVSPEPAQR